jgi:hypothetical protein
VGSENTTDVIGLQPVDSSYLTRGVELILGTYSFVEYPTRMHSFFNSVTSLEGSNCRIHLRSRCRFMDRRRSDSGKSRLGAVSRDPGRPEEQ